MRPTNDFGEGRGILEAGTVASVNGVRSAMFVSRHVRRLARRYGKLSPREVRFLLYAVIAFCLLVAYASTEDHVTDRVVAENFADHRREVGEVDLPSEDYGAVVENVTQVVEFGDEEHTIVIDLRPDDPTHSYLDPNAKVNKKNIKEALKQEGKNKEVVGGQFRGQYLSHMEIGHSKKKPRSRHQTISQVRANPHSTLRKRGGSRGSRSPYSKTHTSNTVYYTSKGGKSRSDGDLSQFHKDGHGVG